MTLDICTYATIMRASNDISWALCWMYQSLNKHIYLIFANIYNTDRIFYFIVARIIHNSCVLIYLRHALIMHYNGGPRTPGVTGSIESNAKYM